MLVESQTEEAPSDEQGAVVFLLSFVLYASRHRTLAPRYEF